MKKNILLITSLVLALSMQAQSSRDCIKQNICEKNECQSVAMTSNNGDAMIYGRNEWIAVGCPNDFSEALYELNVQDEKIQDIHLTELGRWIVLYNNNGTRSDLLYENLKQKIKNCQEDGEKITTITFNDSGDWIVITTKQVSASSDELIDWLIDGCKNYGQIWTACITDDAAIVVYEFGFKFFGNVPEDLKDALRTCESDVYTVKVSGDSWFFRCTDGYGCYQM